MRKVDARGRSCPEPVMMARAALMKEGEGAEILVDNICAVENITRFAAHQGYEARREERDGEYTLTLTKQ